MKTSKRILAVIMSLLMAFSCIGIAGVPAFADEAEETGSEYETITLGEAKEISITTGGENVKLKFVPENDGTYYFYSDSQSDTYGTVYDESMSKVADNDDDGTGTNFCVTVSLTGGETYYLEPRFYNSSTTGNFWAVISDSFTSSHNCEESITAPTCEDGGYSTFTCTRCGYSYVDNYTDPLGHNMVQDKCTRCGLESKTIALGDIKKVKLTDDVQSVVYTFVPEETGTYAFWVDSQYGATCHAYDADMKSVASDFSSSDCVTCDLEAGKTYYLTAESNNTIYVLLSDAFTSIHDLTETVKAPDCENIGYTLHKCSRCGYTYRDSYTSSLGHDYVGGICSRCGLGCEEIGLDDPKSATVTDTDENVMYSFTPTETGTYYLWVDTDKYVSAYVYDSSRKQLTFGYFYSTSLTNKISYTFTAGQTYYISVKSGWSGTVTFYTIISKSFSRDHDFGEAVKTEATTCGEQSYTTATCNRCGYKQVLYDSALEHTFKDGVCTRCGKAVNTISPGDVKKAFITDAGDEVWYAFTPKESGTYYFTADSENDVYLYLYNSDRTTCYSSSYSPADDQSYISCSFEADTTYYFKVKFYSSNDVGVFYALLDDELIAGHDPEEVNTTAPTCTSAGYTTNICSRCGYVYTEDTDAALGHNFVDGVCTKCGTEKLTISLGEVKEVTITEDTGKALLEFKPEKSGTYYFYSDSQSDTYGTVYDSDMEALASNDDGGFETNFNVSYDFEGGETYYLEAGYFSSGNIGSFTVVLSGKFVSSHNYVEKETVEPGCLTKGYTEYVCTRCGYSYNDYESDPLNHNFVDGVCTRCGSGIEDIVPGDIKEITISEAGDTALLRFIPEKSGRYYFWLDGEEGTDATLYDSDMDRLTSVYQYSTSENRICYTFIKGQTYWFACSFGSLITGKFYAILSDTFTSQHAYGEGKVTAPTCETYGYTEYTCTRCGYTYETDTVDPAGHNFENGVCTVCGDGYTDISLGDTKELAELGTAGNMTLRFIPENSGTYYFIPDSNYSCYFCLYDSEWTKLKSLSYYSSGMSFIGYNFKAGETYYFTAEVDYVESGIKTFAILSDDYNTNHNLIYGDVAASCFNEGGKGVVCSRCGYIDTAEETYLPLGHNFVDGVCARCGETCENMVCDETKTFSAEPDGFVWISFTPTVDGSYHFGFSSDCNYAGYVLMENDNGLYSGTYGDAYPGNEGFDYDLKAGTEYIIVVYHDEEEAQNISVTIINNDIANCDHDIVSHDRKASTCTEDGWEAYETCTKCAYTTYKAIPATGHSLAGAVKENETAATCTADGSYDSVVYCSVCNTELSRETISVPATGHNDADRNGYCDNCGALMDADLANPCRNAKINIAASKSVDYKSDVTITATAENVPEGYHLELICDGMFGAEGTNTEVTYHPGKITGNISYTVQVVDVKGYVQQDKDGNELKATSQVTCSSNFFAKIVAFFKGLFGLLPKVTVKP